MLHVDVDDGKSKKTEKDLLQELEIRYPNIYSRKRERKARQDALQLTPRAPNRFNNHENGGADINGRRQLLASIQGKEAKTFGELQNHFGDSKTRLRKLEDELKNDFPQKRIYQRRNTSPEVQFVPDSKPKALKDRLQHNAERLNDLLYNRSPFSEKGYSPRATPRENGQVVREKPLEKYEVNKTRNSSQIRRGSEGSVGILNKITNGNVSKSNPSFNVVCQRIFDNQDRVQKERNSDFLFNSRWRRNSECNGIQTLHENAAVPLMLRSPLQSPGSQADSAIDVESVSVQSEVSSDNHYGGPSSDIFPPAHPKYSDTDEKEGLESSFDGKSQWQSNESRSRPLHSLPNFVGDLAIRSLLSLSTEKEPSSGDESAPRSPDTPRSSVSLSPLVSPKRLKLQGQTTPKKTGPVKADHSLCSSTSSIPHSDRELEEIYLRTHGFANGSTGSVVSSSDEVYDTVDDTDPTREDPKLLHSVRLSTEKHRNPRKHVYVVKKSSESPRYGRVTPITATSSSEDPTEHRQSATSILLDMRVNNSFDESQYVRGKTGSRISDSNPLKSRSLNDMFDGDIESRFKIFLQNRGSHYISEDKRDNEYCSSTDSPLRGQSCLSFNNFTLSPRVGTEEEELTIVMDSIGESKTEDNVSDDSKAVPSSDSASISNQCLIHSDSKSTSSQEGSQGKYVSRLTLVPKTSGKDCDTENERLQKANICESNTIAEPCEAFKDDSLNSDSDRFDQSFDSRASDCDTEFFMEAEFLDSAMKPKKTRFQKLFGGKKGKYNPAAEDIPHMAPKPQGQSVSKSPLMSKSVPDLVHPRTQNINKGQVSVSLTKQDFKDKENQTKEQHQSVQHPKGILKKDVKFSVVENKDDSCVENYSGGLLRAGRINAFEAAAMTDKHKPVHVILEDKSEHLFHARPVVISSGKGSCLDLGVNECRQPQSDLKVLENAKQVAPDMDQNDDVFDTNHDSLINVTLPLKPCQSSDMPVRISESDNAVSAGTFPNSSFLSEGFDLHESFDNRFNQDFNLNGSGSEFASSHNTSHSPRSVWSECEGLQNVDQSFEDDFDGSFTPRTSEIKTSGKDEGGSKDEKEKSSGYGSENSRQTSETKDESLIEDDHKQGKVFSSPLNDEDVDRIFELAKDPPSFGDDSDIGDDLSFDDLNQVYSVQTQSEITNEGVDENNTSETIVAEKPDRSSKNEDDVLSKTKQKDSTIPKPVYSNQSPRIATTTSKVSKGAGMIASSSICSDDTDGTSIASRHQESDDMGMSSESEVIRSAFDFLGSSSDAETLTTARETLMMLEEEEESEEEDLASSIKILSDLRKSLMSENQDLIFAEEIQDIQDTPEVPKEDAKLPSPPAVSEDEDSSFQMDPRPAGVHSEIKVDIHRPNVEDSDNGSEMDAPLDALEDDVIVHGETLLCPDDPDSKATAPKPEDFVDSSVHPLNSTFTISVHKCDEAETDNSADLNTCANNTSLTDELKLPLWESDDQLSSGKSTPRGFNQLHLGGSLCDSSLDDSSTTSELNSGLKQNDPNEQPEASTMKAVESSGYKKDSLTMIKEEYSDKPSGQRYIKKSQMDKKRAILRRQEEVNHDELDNQREVIREEARNNEETTYDNSGDTRQTDLVDSNLVFDTAIKVEEIHSVGSSKSRPDSIQSHASDTTDFSETSKSFSSSFHRLSSASGTYSDSIREFSVDSSADSPHSLTQTDLPEASVSLSDEFNVSGSSEEVWFDDLNKSLNNDQKNVKGVFSPRANAYRKSSEGDDSNSVMSDDSSPRATVTDHKYDLPDVVQNPGTSFLSDSTDNSLKVNRLKTEDPYSRISEEGSSLNDSKEEEPCDLSFNSFISPYATTKSLAKISSTPKSLYKARTAEISCDGIEPVYDPYATIDSSKGDNSNDSDRRCSSASDISPYATVKDFSSLRLNEGVLLTSKDVLVEKSGEISADSRADETQNNPDGVIRSIPEIRIQAPTDHEDEVEDESLTGQNITDLYAKVRKIQSKGENSDLLEEQESCLPQNHVPRGDDSITPLDSVLLGACGGSEEIPDTEDEGPPLPQRKYQRSISSQSNLHSNRELSASRTSLFTNFKASAKVKFHTMRKAMSMDRGLNEVEEEKKKSEKKEKVKEKNKKDKKDKKKKKDDKISKAPSLKSLSSLFGKKSRDRNSVVEGEIQEKMDEPEKKSKKERGSIFKSKKKRLVSVPIEIVDNPTHFRCIGKLRAVNPDGTQMIELSKPAEGPIGFYIAKGTANYDYGTFVSRFRDDQQKLFAGILGVGDEILEINEHSVKDMSLDDVHALMAGTETLVMKVFPIVARKEV